MQQGLLYQKNLLDFCTRENIRIIAYNPLVKGSYVQSLHKEANIVAILNATLQYNEYGNPNNGQEIVMDATEICDEYLKYLEILYSKKNR